METRNYLELTYCSWVNRNKEHGATLPCKVRPRKVVNLATPAMYRLLIE